MGDGVLSPCQSVSMRSREKTIEGPDEFWRTLQGPLGRAIVDAGSILNQRLEAQGKTLSVISEKEMLDMLLVALREVAPGHCQNVDRATVDSLLEEMFALVHMDLAATAISTEARN